jgi:hypothetical protein
MNESTSRAAQSTIRTLKALHSWMMLVAGVLALGSIGVAAAAGPTPGAGPVIEAIQVGDVSQTSATITWTLDVPSTGQVEYGTTDAYGMVTTPELSFDYATHVQDIQDLEPGTEYHFRVKSSNRAGVESVSADQTFTTEASPSPEPVPSNGIGYAAVFTGDASGATDVTDELRVFLESHDGERVALVPNGVYAVSQLTFTASDLTVDFLGARIQGVEVGASGILRIESASNLTLNDPAIYGTGYAWDPQNQNEHGIYVDGGSHITLNHPVTRDTRGDGIYTSYQRGTNDPPSAILINDPDIERAARNGISPVAGEVTIHGGHIAYTGLHGVDFEVNDAIGAASIRGIVEGVDIRHHGDLPGIESTSYAVAAGGYSTATKPSIRVQDLTGDVLRITIRNTAEVIVRDNVSDKRTTADFPGSDSVKFAKNTRIKRI